MNKASRFRTWVGPVLLVLAIARCGGSTTDPHPVASAIAAVQGGTQNGTVGTALPESLAVIVTDAAGDPVAGVDVAWAAQNGGSVGASTVTTDARGRAAVQHVLGPTAGPQTATATVANLEGSPVTFTATAAAVPTPGLTLTTPPPPTAQSGEVFTPQPSLTFSDAGGTPLAGVTVTATLSAGGGLVGVTTTTTNAAGVATFTDLAITGAGTRTLSFAAANAAAVTAQVSIADAPPEAATGKWSPQPTLWPNIVPLHMHLMPTGIVMAWGRAGQPYVFIPSDQSFTQVPVDTMLFCAGHALLPDGKLLVSGGHLSDDRGLPDTHIFAAGDRGGSWTSANQLPDMFRGRWYPTVTELSDGKMVTVAGRDSLAGVVDVPELWDGSQWIRLTGASLPLPYYPRNFLAPDGRIFYAGERTQSRWLDVNATGTNGGPGKWTTGPVHQWPFERDYGSAVMYQPGKIMYVGGGGDPGATGPSDATASAPTSSAELIDLNADASWKYTDSMAFRRRHLNATILPDGQVLVTGGVSGGGFDAISSGVHEAELWNPSTGRWTTLASNSVNRGYHAVSLLLPDGTVLHGASGDANVPGGGGAAYPRETNHEIFSPPYLSKGVRPVISSAPSAVGYGQPFAVATDYPSGIARVTLVKLGSVTHAFDAGQRFVELSFSASASELTVTVPAGATVAPPGYYMLFVLNRNGIPSIAKILKLQ